MNGVSADLLVGIGGTRASKVFVALLAVSAAYSCGGKSVLSVVEDLVIVGGQTTQRT